MSNPHGGLRVIIGGAVGATDQWNIGVLMNQDAAMVTTAASPAEMNTVASDVLNLFNTNVWSVASGLKAYCRASTTLQFAKSYQYNNAGLLLSQGAASITAVPGTGTGNMPGYVAAVMTLQTDTPGRSGRGRTYLPITSSAAMSATGQFSDLTNIVNAYGTFLTNCHKAYTIGGITNSCPVIIWSSKTSTVQYIKAVRADSIPDTQRGRINKDVAAGLWSKTVS